MHISPQEVRPRVWAGDTARPGLWEPDSPLDGAEEGDRGGREKAQNGASGECQGGLLGAGCLRGPSVTAGGLRAESRAASRPPTARVPATEEGAAQGRHTCASEGL